MDSFPGPFKDKKVFFFFSLKIEALNQKFVEVLLFFYFLKVIDCAHQICEPIIAENEVSVQDGGTIATNHWIPEGIKDFGYYIKDGGTSATNDFTDQIQKTSYTKMWVALDAMELLKPRVLIKG